METLTRKEIEAYLGQGYFWKYLTEGIITFEKPTAHAFANSSNTTAECGRRPTWNSNDYWEAKKQRLQYKKPCGSCLRIIHRSSPHYLPPDPLSNDIVPAQPAPETRSAVKGTSVRVDGSEG